jgi:GAF domain-containing protein
MAAYRLYFLDSKNAIQARQDFAAADDGEAQTVGALLWQACADCYDGYELWQLTRRIACETGIPAVAPSLERLGPDLKTRLLALQESLLGSRWRAAESVTLRVATESLRRILNGSAPAGIGHQDMVRYIVGKTGTKMMSLQLTEGLRLMLRGSRGFSRVFDEFFAVVVTGHCACGVAFENARQIVVPAIDASPIFAGQESLGVLRGQGVASCVSTPLLGSNGRIAGMFSIHRDRVWSPLEGELAQLRHIAKDIAAALADPLGTEAQLIRTVE